MRIPVRPRYVPIRPAGAAERTSRRYPGKSRSRSPAWRMRVLGRDPIRCMHRHADAAAHADAIDQRDIRLRIGRDHQVERVFLGEERLTCMMLAVEPRTGAARGCRRRRRRPGRRRPRSPRRAHADRRATGQRPRAGADHREVERVERLRAVQHDPPQPPVASGDHVCSSCMRSPGWSEHLARRRCEAPGSPRLCPLPAQFADCRASPKVATRSPT